MLCFCKSLLLWCISYLLLCNKFPPNVMVLGKTTFIISQLLRVRIQAWLSWASLAQGRSQASVKVPAGTASAQDSTRQELPLASSPGRIRSLQAVGLRAPSVPCHMGLSIAQLTTWQVASSMRAKKGQRTTERWRVSEFSVL